MPVSGQQFRREERLKSRKEIERLFREGKSFGHYPLRLIWLPMRERRSEYPVQFALSVPKRKFKGAVQRNRIRRQVREAYRLNKHRLYRGLAGEERQIACMILYIAGEPLPFSQIEMAMQGMIRRFLKNYQAGQKTDQKNKKSGKLPDAQSSDKDR